MGLLKMLIPAFLAWILYSYFMGRKEEDVSDIKERVYGKKVLITGASSGIGEAVAYQYAEMGASVVVTARKEDRLKQVVAKCKELGIDTAVHSYIKADMSKPRDVNAVVSKAVNLLGGLDVLILNHAQLEGAHSWKGTKEEISTLREILEVSFTSHVLLVSDALPHLELSKGSFGVVSSFLGHNHIGGAYVLGYISAKHAVDGFFDGLRLELQDKSSNVSITIFPLGTIDTVAFKRALQDFSSILPDLPLAPVEGAARAIIRGTALREWNVWYPASQKHWWMILLNHMFPEYMSQRGNLVRTWFFSPY